MANVAGSTPSRSESEDWEYKHLDDTANQLRITGLESERLFEQHITNIAAPGGTTWTGAAKDAAFQSGVASLAMVRRQREVLEQAASIAERGARDVANAKRATLNAIADAEADGFTVSDDLSVLDTAKHDVYSAGARYVAAKEHAENIRWNAAQLVQADALAGRRLTQKADELESIPFERSGSEDAITSMLDDRQSSDHSSDDKHSAPGKLPSTGEHAGETGGPEFVISPPTKPDLTWDEDFAYGSVTPSWRDYVSRAEWEAKMLGGRFIRPDLDDATQMYKHYWENNGTPIKFDYGEAYREDAAIKSNVDDQVGRAQRGAEDLIRSGNTNFSMSGDASAAPAYPTTENWQKTIGRYQQWSSADVSVHGNQVTMTVTVHAEDHYNFNGGQSDIATGAADNENGRFTELGWAKPFDSHGEITRTVTWTLGGAPSEEGGAPQFNPGREDRADGRGSSTGWQWPNLNRNSGAASLP